MYGTGFGYGVPYGAPVIGGGIVGDPYIGGSMIGGPVVTEVITT